MTRRLEKKRVPRESVYCLSSATIWLRVFVGLALHEVVWGLRMRRGLVEPSGFGQDLGRWRSTNLCLDAWTLGQSIEKGLNSSIRGNVEELRKNLSATFE